MSEAATLAGSAGYKRARGAWEYCGRLERSPTLARLTAGTWDGMRARSHRVRLGWSVTDLAHEVGVSAVTLAEWERNDTSPSRLSALVIAAALGVSPASLFDIRTESAPPPLPPE